jgi:hypothetical protein
MQAVRSAAVLEAVDDAVIFVECFAAVCALFHFKQQSFKTSQLLRHVIKKVIAQLLQHFLECIRIDRLVLHVRLGAGMTQGLRCRVRVYVCQHHLVASGVFGLV